MLSECMENVRSEVRSIITILTVLIFMQDLIGMAQITYLRSLFETVILLNH